MADIWSGGPTIDLSAMTYSYDEDNQPVILNRVDDARGALTNPIALLTRQFPAASRPRVVGQLADSLGDSLPVLFPRDGFEFFHRRRLDENFKSCHAVLGP
jgi:hypothetical protein